MKMETNCSKNMEMVVETNCSKNMEMVANYCSKKMEMVANHCSKNMEIVANCSKEKVAETKCSKNMGRQDENVVKTAVKMSLMGKGENIGFFFFLGAKLPPPIAAKSCFTGGQY